MYVSLRVCAKKTQKTHLRAPKEKVPQISKKINTCKTAQPSAPYHVSSNIASACKNLYTSKVWALTVKRKVGQSGRSDRMPISASRSRQPAGCPPFTKAHTWDRSTFGGHFLSLLPLLIYLSTLVSCNPGMPNTKTTCGLAQPVLCLPPARCHHGGNSALLSGPAQPWGLHPAFSNNHTSVSYYT